MVTPFDLFQGHLGSVKVGLYPLKIYFQIMSFYNLDNSIFEDINSDNEVLLKELMKLQHSLSHLIF